MGIKALLIASLLVGGQLNVKSPFYVAGVLKKPTSGGSLDVWQDVQSSGTTDTMDADTSTRLNWTAIVANNTGTIDKLRIYIGTVVTPGACTFRLSLYTAGGALISGATGTGVTPASNNYLEVTLGTPASFSNGTTYYIAFMANNGDGYVWYKDGTGSLSYNTSENYASQPDANLPTDNGPVSRSYAVSAHYQ